MVTSFNVTMLRFANMKAYWFTFAFIAGNLLLPQLCHLTPYGGNVLLPIYFFTLVAAYKFGWQVGLATAIFSPLVNCAIFGMPSVVVLPFILIKSILLAVAAVLVAHNSKRLSVLHLLAVVLLYQVVGSVLESLILWDVWTGIVDFRLGISGMLIQVLGGYLVLKALAKL